MSIKKKNSNTVIKDLITTGIFTAICFAIFFASGLVGLVPVLLIAVPFIATLLMGIPFMLFTSKINHFGMVTIMGTIFGILMFATGHTWIPIVMGPTFGLAADGIMYIKKYKSIKLNLVGFGVFSLCTVGAMMPLFVMRESYLSTIREGYGDNYADTITKLTPPWIIPIIIASILVAALIGGLIGCAVLKKHFKRSGLI